jgi:hypothetical protein
MDLQADIKWIQKELNEVKDATLLEAIKNILMYRSKETTPERLSIEQYNKEVDKAIERVEKGEFYTQEEAEKIMDKW